MLAGTVASIQPPTSLPLPNPRILFPRKLANSGASHRKIHTFSPLSTFPFHSSLQREARFQSQTPRISPNSSSSSSASVGSAEYIEEPSTNVKFQTSLTLPECSTSLSLIGTGYREKVFAIIGVKVYAAGLYLNDSIFSKFHAWKGRSSADIQEDSSLFDSIFQAPQEKALQIVLVRDVDGKTFWNALDEAVSPRIKAPSPVDESALSTFRSIFQGRSLRKGTFIFLTWMEPAKMLVCISSDGLPSSVDTTIKSMNVTEALFDVFFGSSPVSPSLKTSISRGIATILK